MGSFPIAAITDEFSLDLDEALDAMAKIGMTGAELRLIGDRNMIDLSDAEVADVRRRVERRGMSVLSIASPVLKCVLPDAPPVDERLEQDVVGSAYTIDDQPRLSKRAFELAEMTGANCPRVFVLEDNGSRTMSRSHRRGAEGPRGSSSRAGFDNRPGERAGL